jgi:hypothetical protein
MLVRSSVHIAGNKKYILMKRMDEEQGLDSLFPLRQIFYSTHKWRSAQTSHDFHKGSVYWKISSSPKTNPSLSLLVERLWHHDLHIFKWLESLLVGK